eukprot:TRINITY_DN1029_c0_g1_i1.p1 TRINITY_DN1029_c0_g1~~TRINITY_DN1029_c0_g1_i1.p1  ORF type:complete len:332 (-),score=56.73 TRINITY_DN1029_c0_g1_i1:69-1064(-)
MCIRDSKIIQSKKKIKRLELTLTHIDKPMNFSKVLEQLQQGNHILKEFELIQLCKRMLEIFNEESNILLVSTPVNVCGDIHGQFYDLMELFKVGGEIPNKNYVFIGDYVDRGYNGVETIEYLLCLKALYPDKITLLRGNHESRVTTQAYGFYDECTRKYGNVNAWRKLCEVFDYMPLGCVIDGSILCIHGGLSPDISMIEQIRTIDRNQEIPLEGPFTDLLWSDPDEVETWAQNSRGAGWLFGDKVTKKFNQINDISLVIRAHQLVEEGYQYWFDKALVTLWSAPNYCYRMGNKAMILQLSSNLDRNFIEFKEQPQSSQQQPPRKQIPYFL